MKKVRVSFDKSIPLSSQGTHKATLLSSDGDEHNNLQSQIITIIATALSKMQYGDLKEIVITKLE